MKTPLSFEFNNEKYEIHRTLKEITINESTGTFEFKNAPMFIDLVTFSSEKFIRPVTYKYTLEDRIFIGHPDKNKNTTMEMWLLSTSQCAPRR